LHPVYIYVQYDHAVTILMITMRVIIAQLYGHHNHSISTIHAFQNQ